MSILLTLFLLGDFSAVNVRPISEDEVFSMDEPKSLVYWNDQVYAVDRSCKLWIYSPSDETHYILGGKGEGPDKILPGVMSMYHGPKGLEIIHRGGTVRSRLQEGSLKGQRLPSSVVYAGERFSVAYKAKGYQPMVPGTIEINRSSQQEEVPLCDIEGERISAVSGLMVVESPKYILLSNRQGLKRTFYLLVISKNSVELINKGQAPMLDKRLLEKHEASIKNLPDHLSPVIADGATYSEEYGLVISEYTTYVGDQTVAHCVNPETLQSLAIRIHFGRDDRLTNFLHIRDETWAAYDGSGLVMFELKER